jgi:membrane protease YdiL (CAAX protease family)
MSSQPPFPAVTAASELPSARRATSWLRFPLLRILAAFLAVAIPFMLVATPFNVLVSSSDLKRLGAILLVIVVFAAYTSYVRLVEKRAVRELALQGATLELLSGLVLGSALFSGVIGILIALGVCHITGSNGVSVMLASIPGYLLFGVLEEVIGRAIVLRILDEWLGSWPALLLSALLFGALHLFNHGATLIDGVAIAMEGGLLLGAAYLYTRRLWLCIGIHTAWNFTQGGIFSVSVSGQDSHGLLNATLSGPDWLTGGAFGVEGSVVAMLVCAIAAAGLLSIAFYRKQATGAQLVQPT